MSLVMSSSTDARTAVGGPLGTWWPGRECLLTAFRVNRRSSDRWALRGTATLLSLGADLGLVVELDRLAGAPWWLAGSSITPLTVGTRVSVGFSDPCCRPGTAVVVRCERSSGRAPYRIAVRFDGRSPCDCT